jgi:two-component system sensor histidine kinase RstB
MRTIIFGGLIILVSMITASLLSVHFIINLTKDEELAWYKTKLQPPVTYLAGKLEGEEALSVEDLEKLGEKLGAMIVVYDDDALLQEYNLAEQILEELGRATSSSVVLEVNIAEGEMITAFKRLRNGQILALGVPEEPPINTTNIVLFALSCGLIVTVITSLMVFLPMLRRLRVLEKTAEAIQGGDLSRRADVEGADDIGQFAFRFNRMSERLHYHVKRQQEILAAISHELKTPVSRIRFSLDLFGRAKDSEKRKHYEERLDADLDELDSLIDELLVYARFDSSQRELKTSRFDIALEIDSMLSVATTRFPDIDVKVDVGHFKLAAERKLFQRALSNLIENALRFAESKVTIRSTTQQGGIVLEVINDGPVIPEEHRESVFEAFHRIDSSRNRRSGGVGLGLWITRQILKAHDGLVTCGTTQDGKTCFRTEWPLEPLLPATKRYKSPTQR